MTQQVLTIKWFIFQPGIQPRAEDKQHDKAFEPKFRHLEPPIELAASLVEPRIHAGLRAVPWLQGVEYETNAGDGCLRVTVGGWNERTPDQVDELTDALRKVLVTS